MLSTTSRPLARALNGHLPSDGEALMLAGDFAIYVLFPLDVAWQVNSSVERLVLQLWPAALLAFFLAASPLQLVPAPVAAEKPKQTKRHR